MRLPGAPHPLRRMKYLPLSRRSSVWLALCWLPSASLAHAETGVKSLPHGAKPTPAAKPPAAKSTAPCVTRPATTTPSETPLAPAPVATPVTPSPWSTSAPGTAATVTVSLPAAPSVARLIESARRGPREARGPQGSAGVGAAGPLADARSELPGPTGLSSREKWSIATAGVGLVSLGVMTGFGLRAMAKHSQHEAGCASETGCTQAANDALDSARMSAHVSHAFGIMGALSLGASAYLFFFRSDAKPRRVGVMPMFGLSKDVGLAAGGMTMKASW